MGSEPGPVAPGPTPTAAPQAAPQAPATHLPTDPPAPSLGAVFLLFLGFGLRAWGGPAAQIAMLRDDLVARRAWLDRDHFNRLLAVYQVLPGPEATEMCVHLGYLRRGRLGGLLAGMGFVLPGFLLMLGLAVAYMAAGPDSDTLRLLLAGFPPAVAALVAVACIRLGSHALHDERLMGLGLAVLVATLLGVPFYVSLPLAGIAGLLPARVHALGPAMIAVATVAWAVLVASGSSPAGTPATDALADDASVVQLAWSGLKAGALTFGGAYTALPFLQDDAVGRYVTQEQFLDGVALSGILPAPFIIFATFLGYVGGGWAGAFAMTAAIFLPAFAFSLLGARHIEGLANHRRLARFLDGVTAGVIGLLAATALGLLLLALSSGLGFVLALAAFLALAGWKSRWATPIVILACGAVGAAVSWAAL